MSNTVSGNLESLTELVLSNNNIQKIPKQLSTLSQLKELKIAHNKIDSIPAGTYYPLLFVLLMQYRNPAAEAIRNICTGV